MIMFIDGTCAKCGGHTSSLDGGPPRCYECGWVCNREDWEIEMEQVSKFIEKLLHKDDPEPEPPEEDEKMIEETRKPRICDLLGVDVGEWFGFDYPHKKYEKCCVNVDGKIVEMWNTGKLHNVGGNAVCWIINHPDCVIRRPHFTDEEMAALRVLYDSGARWLARGKHLRWYAHEPYRRPDDGKWDMQGCWGTMSGKLPAKLFHSVLPGQSVPLLDIIEEATP